MFELIWALIAGAPAADTPPAADDWEYAEDVARKGQVAAVRYDSGQSLVASCQDGRLKVTLAGLPPSNGPEEQLDAVRSDGRADRQVWRTETPGTLVSKTPARDARFLRVGGALKLRSVERQPGFRTSFDLPAEHANLDRVLTACGYPLAEERDMIPRVAAGMRMARTPSPDSIGGVPGRSQEISCIVRDGRFQECRTDHTVEGQSRKSQIGSVASLLGAKVHEADGAANEGRIAYIFVPLAQVVYQ